MSLNKASIFAFALALGLSSVPAQAEQMTLDTILMLAQTGIGDEAVIAKINSTDTHLDLTVDQMLDLKKKGISGPVIAAILNSKNSAVVAQKLSLDAIDPAVPHPTGVYLLDDSAGKMVRIDATVTNQVKTGGILGYAFTGGLASVSVKATIQNPTAKTHAPTGQPVFYFFFDDSNPQTANAAQTWASGTSATVTSPSEFTLIRMTQKDGRRETRVGSMNIAGAKTGVMDKDRIPFDYSLVRPGVYKVQIGTVLPKGEYGFIFSLTGGGAAGAVTARIFDFSV
jgi:hypothetical protein